MLSKSIRWVHYIYTRLIISIDDDGSVVVAKFGSVQVRGLSGRTPNLNLVFGSATLRTSNLNARSGSVQVRTRSNLKNINPPEQVFLEHQKTV
jgi:hypothetical protein